MTTSNTPCRVTSETNAHYDSMQPDYEDGEYEAEVYMTYDQCVDKVNGMTIAQQLDEYDFNEVIEAAIASLDDDTASNVKQAINKQLADVEFQSELAWKSREDRNDMNRIIAERET